MKLDSPVKYVKVTLRSYGILSGAQRKREGAIAQLVERCMYVGSIPAHPIKQSQEKTCLYYVEERQILYET